MSVDGGLDGRPQDRAEEARGADGAPPPADWSAAAARAWTLWRPHRARLTVLLLLTLVTIAGDVALPWVTGRLIDALAGTGGSPGGLEAALWFLALYLGLSLAVQSLRTLFAWLWHRPTLDILYRGFLDGTEAVLRQEVHWHLSRSAGEPVRDIQRGVWAYDGIASRLLFQLLPSVLMLGALLVLVATISALASLLSLVAGGVFLAFAAWAVRSRVGPRYAAATQADTQLSGGLTDLISGHAIVTAFALRRREMQRLTRDLDHWRATQRQARYANELVQYGQAALLLVLQGLLIGGGLLAFAQDRASPGDMVFLLSASFMIQMQVRGLGDHIASLEQEVREAAPLAYLLDREPMIQDPPRPQPLPPGGGHIAFTDVTFAYPGTDRPVLRSLSFEVASGEVVALAGPSGVGKSTVIKLLTRLYDRQAGQITVDGVDVSAMGLDSLRQAVAVVPQDPALFNRSLWDNVTLACPEASPEAVRAVLATVGLGDLEASLPEGLATPVGDRGHALSGGQRQRVAIARAVLAGARVLVLDEATANLDAAHADLIHGLLPRLAQDRSVLVISHRDQTLAACNRTIQLRPASSSGGDPGGNFVPA